MSEQRDGSEHGAPAGDANSAPPLSSTPAKPESGRPMSDQTKKILIFVGAAVLLFLLKDVIFAMIQFAVFLAVLAGIGIVGYSGLQLMKENEFKRLRIVAADQQQFLQSTDRNYNQNPETLIRMAQDYFLEKTWGFSGLKWRINNIDHASGKIVADFECAETKSGEILPASSVSSAPPPKGLGIFPAILPSAGSSSGGRRYVSVRMQISPDTMGGAHVSYDWDFRFPEQSVKGRPEALPNCLYDVCKDLVASMDRNNA